MRRFFLVLTFLMISLVVVFAQAPEKMTYQAVVRNNANVLIANQNVTVRMSILQGSAQGAAVYVEHHSTTTNANGLMTVEIGGGSPTSGVFANINWGVGPYFLKSEIDPEGGINYSIESVQQLLSVPYALYAKEAGNGFSGDYNDLTNVPTFTESQILSISNDTIYLTGGSFVKLPAGFDGDYNSLTNKPVIPTVPTDVSAFTNDAGYITQASVPTNVSQLSNDAGYLTSFTESQILSISNDTIYLTGGSFVKLPAGFDGDYNSLTNKPTIPTVPTDVSAFTNDVGYITQASVPTNVSQLSNDAGYLTSFTESQILSISNDTIYLTGGSFVKLPAGFDGDYNSLTNKPVIPTVPTDVSAFTNDAGYITKDSIPTNVSAFTNDAGYLIGTDIPLVPTNVSAFANDAHYLTEADLSTINNQLSNMQGQLNAQSQALDGISYVLDTMNGHFQCGRDLVYDHEGNAYNTVAIGSQCWMKENMRATTSPTTGAYIVNPLHVSGNSATMNSYSKAAHWPNNDSVMYAPLNYGLLYNWPAAMDTFCVTCGAPEVANGNTSSSTSLDIHLETHHRGICPEGWHIPNKDELTEIISYVSDKYTYSMKALASQTGWETYMPNNDSLGLSVIAAGAYQYGSMSTMGSFAGIWSSTTSTANFPIQYYFRFDYNSIAISGQYACFGLSVRCICDEPIHQANGWNDNSTYMPAAIDSLIDSLNNEIADLQALLEDNNAAIENLNGGFVCGISTVKDFEGNVYKTVGIGSQCWMKENLKTKYFFDGTKIETADSLSINVPLWYEPYYNQKGNGLMYNWLALTHNEENTNNNPYGMQGICPPGWHVPSYSEFNQLTNYVANKYSCDSNSAYVGKALASNIYWPTSQVECSPGSNLSENNASGFSALPAGFVWWAMCTGGCSGYVPLLYTERAAFWTSDQYRYTISSDDPSVSLRWVSTLPWYYGATAYSVRCIKDVNEPESSCCVNLGLQIADLNNEIDSLKGELSTQRHLLDILFSRLSTIDGLPTVNTSSVSFIRAMEAQCGGDVLYSGGSDILTRGVCWSTAPNPTVSDNHISCGSGLGAFSVKLENLQPNTTYHLRAYATNVSSTVYGDPVVFTTLQATVPSLATPVMTFMNDVEVGLSSSVLDDGNCNITERGFCWSHSGIPTIVDEHTSETGTSVMTNPDMINWIYLTIGKTYQIRAYAVNEFGIGYSDPIYVPFATPPTLDPDPLYEYRDSVVHCEGILYSDGGYPITDAGVCWGMEPNPTISDNHLSVGITVFYADDLYGDVVSADVEYTENLGHIYTDENGDRYYYHEGYGSNIMMQKLNVITADITGLSPFSTYYFRVYATNVMGTTYSEYFTVTLRNLNDGQSCPNMPTVTDYDGNTYNTVQIGTQCWLKENLRVKHYSDGEEISITYPNHNINNASEYGCLYNWASTVRGANSVNVSPSGIQGVCPIGWHVPSSDEYNTLLNYRDYDAIKSLFVPQNAGINGYNSVYFGDFSVLSTTTLSSNGWVAVAHLYNDHGGFSTESVGTYCSVRCIRDYSSSTVSTKEVTNITNSSAKTGGDLITDGGNMVFQRGVCWNTSPNPTVDGQHVIFYGDGDDYNLTLNGLDANTTYYVRAYAVDNTGTVYGNELSFTTGAASLPVVATDSVWSASNDVAFAKGTVSSMGGLPMTASGICWGTAPNPTLSDNHTTCRENTGNILVQLTGVHYDTTYYFRAYATNALGTVYGNELSLTPGRIPPVVSTNKIGNISQNSAVCGGSIGAYWDEPLIVQGLCWSIDSNPTIYDSNLTESAGRFNFSVNMEGLLPGTTYYVRAFAVNSHDTIYGELRRFTTSQECGTL
ncbi:MAG: hypothetical protein K5846_03100, partial [Bacteroidales bacterium]|nr:hypothetical protein [Bacteroidales bacterium]